jgi:LmbE family N-acetylglucosaminyl deacetylase
MLRLAPAPANGRGLELLCLGAHSDDLEIGCSGTVFRWLEEQRIERITWVVLSGNAARAAEAQRSARSIFGEHPGFRLIVESFRDGYFPYTAVPIKDFFESLKPQVQPDVVLTHYRDDRHQDHRLVSELTYNTFRDHLILEYEIMKRDGDLGQPNAYIALDDASVDRKVDHLMSQFGTQRDRSWFSEDAFRGLMRLRGIEAGAPSGHAEAFHCRTLVL